MNSMFFEFVFCFRRIYILSFHKLKTYLLSSESANLKHIFYRLNPQIFFKNIFYRLNLETVKNIFYRLNLVRRVCACCCFGITFENIPASLSIK